MMIQANFLLALATGCLLLAAPHVAFANPEKIAKLAEDLNLTSDQKVKLQKIHDEYHQALPPKKEAMMSSKTALQAALRGQASEDECRRKFDDLDRKQSEFGRARFKKILAIRALLTPEQRAKFRAYEP